MPAVFKQTYPSFEVIVVDNGSTDGAVAWLESVFPPVRLVCNGANLGFAKANNQGISVAQGDYLVTLNNDTLPEPNWLVQLVNGLVADDVGMVASKMLVWDAPERVDSAGIMVDWVDSEGYRRRSS